MQSAVATVFVGTHTHGPAESNIKTDRVTDVETESGLFSKRGR